MPTKVEALAEGLIAGNRRALARSITLIESTRPDHASEAQALLELVRPHTGGAVRVGITGTPGVGKSTFIDRLGTDLVDRGHKLSVLAVDPSSQSVGGSILGDKTRMASLTNADRAFIRPSPSRGITGGVAARTRDAVLLCEAAGYDVVFVETVGVGQSETAVAEVTDLFLLLLAPGGGDDLQGIKRGVMELADVIAINKADGSLVDLAASTAVKYQQALSLVRPKRRGETVPVLTVSSVDGNGVDDLWTTIVDLHCRLESNGSLARLRLDQARRQLDAQVAANLISRVTADPAFAAARQAMQEALAAGEITVTAAAGRLTDAALAATPVGGEASDAHR